MPPSGPRSRANQPPPPARNANVRNEAFESIFGRPAGGHHMAGGPGPGGGGGAPPPQQPHPHGPQHGYGYQSRPPAGGQPQPPSGYLHPSQPAYPPAGQYRGAPGFPPQQQQQFAARNDFGVPPPPPPQQLPQPQPYPQEGYRAYGGHPNSELLDRRASLAPSTYSNSSASFYSPTPDATSPIAQTARRMPSQTFPAPSAHRIDPPPRSTNGSLNPSAAQAYQSAYAPSPTTSVFPSRPNPSPLPGPGPSRDSSMSSGRIPSGSQSDYQRRPVLDVDTRHQSPTAGMLQDFERMGFDGIGGGPLDTVPGIPKKGSDSPSSVEFGKLAERYSGDFDSQDTHRRTNTRGSSSSTGTAGMHRRMTSESSMSSGGYTLTGIGRTMAPLSQIESPTSPETPTDSYNFAARANDRKSVDSTISLPDGLPPGAAVGYDRSISFSGSSANRKEASMAARSGSVGHGTATSSRRPTPGPAAYGFPNPLPSNRSLHDTLQRSQSSARHIALSSIPNIYPALLSRVAEVFKQLISLAELAKDGITYKDAFDGRTAVSIIGDIIKTPDRNLALLLGRALDAQKMFHDVTYDHRLRDNPHEVYQFKERLSAPFMPAGGAVLPADSPTSEHTGLARATSSGSTTIMRRPGPAPLPQTPESQNQSLHMSDSLMSVPSTAATPATSNNSLAQTPGALNKALPADGEDDGEEDLPVGVFTLLTDCYSPTCSRESLCYSINCPRRLEQMKRLNMKPTGLSRKLSEESIHDVKETGTLWVHSVSQEILDSVDDREKSRQEAINEVIYTERDFVRDLEYLKESWVKPLLSEDIIPAARREDFVRQVFWNVHDVWSVNHILGEKLTKRQKQQPVVQSLGDLFLERVPLFEPFVAYGAHQLFGKYEFEKEKGANPAFQKFVDETERKPESRKLELNGYLTKPTTRLGRYPLLLAAVLKYTPDDHPDKKDLAEAIKLVRALLTKVNIESGKSENIFELAQLEQQLVWRPSETIDLRLRDKSREMVHKGPLKRRGGNRDEIADLLGFLFDHAFLLAKPKHVNKAEQLRVYRRPIPLELLVIITPDEAYNAKLSAGRGTAGKLIARTSASSRSTNPTSNGSSAINHVPPKPDSKHGYSITIVHLGKKGYSMQLWVDTYVSRKKWLEAIDKQQMVLRERSCVFMPDSITEGYFVGLRRIHCVSPYDNGNRMIYGTDDGVYFSNLRDPKLREPVKVINLLDVTQVDVIEEFQLLIVLHERSVTTFPLDCLDPNDPNAAMKRGKRIASHTSFFKSGLCLGKMLVAVVKSSTLSSTIKVLEPVDPMRGGKKVQGGFMKRLNGGNEALKLFKEFYIPTESSSVHFLKTKLCVGCTKGFEIVDLETLDMQGLLDPSDQSLDFVLKRDNVRPIAIYRIEEDFLLCYDEFAFYVNKNGWRSRPKWAIVWEGVPTAFALQFPYVIAFEPTFVEVRSVHTGDLVQIIPGNNITCLFADTPPSRVNSAPQQQNRQMMFSPQPGQGPPGSYRPPPQGYGQGGFPNPQQGYGNGYRPPLPGQHGYMPPPPQSQPSGPARFNRDQIIFTSEEGHVQFLKLPPAGSRGSGSAAASVSGNSSAAASSTTLVSSTGGGMPGGRLESIRGSR